MYKSHRKKVLEKNNWILKFSEVLGQNVTGNKVLSFRFLKVGFPRNDHIVCAKFA